MREYGTWALPPLLSAPRADGTMTQEEARRLFKALRPRIDLKPVYALLDLKPRAGVELSAVQLRRLTMLRGELEAQANATCLAPPTDPIAVFLSANPRAKRLETALRKMLKFHPASREMIPSGPCTIPELRLLLRRMNYVSKRAEGYYLLRKGQTWKTDRMEKFVSSTRHLDL